LDRASVLWLEKYLISKKNVTCLIVSHDSGYVRIFMFPKIQSDVPAYRFLDNVTTDIMHYEGKKVRPPRSLLPDHSTHILS
jgi:elongation factor 3